jgi:hypothetical protein
MSRLRFRISLSLDGFVAGPGQSVDNPIGIDAATATTVRVRDGRRLVVDGPFAETKEQLAGYYILECRDLCRSFDWAEEAMQEAFARALAEWPAKGVPTGNRPRLSRVGIHDGAAARSRQTQDSGSSNPVRDTGARSAGRAARRRSQCDLPGLQCR